MIPIIISVRGVIFTSIILVVLGIFVIINSTKDKSEYEKKTGIIEYFDKTYMDFPNRNHGDYRYLKIDNYQYVFEIYIANTDKEVEPIDDLKIGDRISVYYYETGSTHSENLNRYIQFIDKNSTAYFKRGNFQKQLGFVILGLVVFLNILSFVFWKKGKLAW